MGTWIRALSAAAFVMAAAGHATAQAPAASVKGIVRDHSGTPVHGAVVRIATPDKSMIRVVSTDLRGEYAFHGLEPRADYALRVSHPAFREASVDTAANNATLDVSLTPRRKGGKR